MNVSRQAAAQVMVIGIDGASWAVLDFMIAAGLMPNLSRLIETGARAPLTSILPPISPPAWSSFITGKNPGKHGIFEWWEALNLHFVPLTSRDIDGATLWQLLSEGGKRIGVFNVPMTYPLPAHAIDGFMVAGLPLPGVQCPFTYPASLREELLSMVGDYTIDTHWVDYERRPDGRRALMRDLAAELEQRRKIAVALLERYDSDFFMVVLAGNDRLSHCLWKYIGLEPDVELDAEGLQLQSMIRDYYSQLDGTLGDLLRHAGPQTTVLVCSDHGFGPLRKEIYINRWLTEEGFLVSWSGARRGRLANAAVRLARRMGLRSGQLRRLLGTHVAERAQELAMSARIDWSRTTAYSHSPNSIQINLKGREPHGVVNPGSEYETVRTQAMERLRQLRDPDTGASVVSAMLRREEVYEGPHLQRGPDLLLCMADQGYAANCDLHAERAFQPAGWKTGQHKLQGILVAAGKHIQKGARIDQAGIMDLAPTILYRMGVPIPNDMDGQVLSDLFEKPFLRSHAPQRATPPEVPNRVSADLERGTDREVILERLRGLGYLD